MTTREIIQKIRNVLDFGDPEEKESLVRLIRRISPQAYRAFQDEGLIPFDE